MNRRRIAAAVILLAALAVMGSAAAASFAAKSHQDDSAEQKVVFQDVPPPNNAGEVLKEEDLIITGSIDPAEVKTGFHIGALAKPAPKPTPAMAPPPGKSLPQEPHSARVSQVQLESPAGKEATQGEVYTWFDGDRVMRAVLQNDLVVQETNDIMVDDDVVVSRGQGNVVRRHSTQGSGGQPVFEPESGGGLMTLPGGVLLALDAGWGQAAVEGFFVGNGISMDRVSDLDFMDNGFLVETEPGFPSLDLANDLAQQDGVVAASPNWWREREAR